MQNAVVTPDLATIEAAVLECIVYADLFDFPLTPGEVRRWLAVPATLDEVEAAVTGARLGPILSEVPPYITLAGRESIVALRERRKLSSAALRRRAVRYGRLIGRLPFVRMVAITGSIAVDNADAGDDLDYLIVTAPGRVWLTRAMIMAVGRIAGLWGATLCPNYLLAETALALPERDYYTARELLQMQPLVGRALYERMLAANPWWRDFLPNARPHPPAPSPCVEKGRTPEGQTPESVRPEPGSPEPGRRVEGREAMVPAPLQGRKEAPPHIRRGVESFLSLPPFDVLERWILAHKGAELRRTGGEEAVFDDTMCKGHFDRWRERTQRRLAERMHQVKDGAP